MNQFHLSFQRKPIRLFQPRESIIRGIILPSCPCSLMSKIHLIFNTHMKGKTLSRWEKANCLRRTLQNHTLMSWKWGWFSKVSLDGSAGAEEGPIAPLIQELLRAPKCGFSYTHAQPLDFCIAEICINSSCFPGVGQAADNKLYRLPITASVAQVLWIQKVWTKHASCHTSKQRRLWPSSHQSLQLLTAHPEGTQDGKTPGNWP